jgi:hypothetical protein
MIDIGGVFHFMMVVFCCVVAMGTFVAASQSWMLTRNRWYETVALLLICFTLFRPGYWLDWFQPPFESRSAGQLIDVAGGVPLGTTIRFRVDSQSRSGEAVEKLVRLTMRDGQGGTDRLARAGVVVRAEGNEATVQSIRFGSEASKYGLNTGDRIIAVLVPAERASRYWFVVPALLLLAGIVLLQLRRRQLKPAMAA